MPSGESSMERVADKAGKVSQYREVGAHVSTASGIHVFSKKRNLFLKKCVDLRIVGVRSWQSWKKRQHHIPSVSYIGGKTQPSSPHRR